MKSLFGIIVALALIGGGYYYIQQHTAAHTAVVPPTPEVVASTTAGINGSPNQGNLGTTSTRTVQQPMADGQEDPVIGNNVALGTDSKAKIGTYLIGYNGMTVYTFKPDDTGGVATSTCYGTCAQTWMPYIVSPVDKINQLKLGVNGKTGTVTRTDGQLQLTYNGVPLYFYSKDTASGDVKGNGVKNAWFVVRP